MTSCCAPPHDTLARPQDAKTAEDQPLRHAVFAVEGIHCAGCIRAIETSLAAVPGIQSARVNLTLRRVTVGWHGDAVDPDEIPGVLKAAGYRATPFEAGSADATAEKELRRLLLALAVAGFAAMNIMLLSVSVWAGNASDIAVETRDLFHWISALIALPAAAFAGRPFYESAIRALSARRLNMDVPITVGVLMALGLSVYQTMISAHHAYFESAIMLLFFLLAGRVLEQVMRRKTRAMAGNLSAFKASSADRILADGTTETVPPALLAPGDRIRIKPGDRVPVDGVVVTGQSQADQSMITGETRPDDVGPGKDLYAGALNLHGVLTLEVRSAAGDTVIDEIQNLLDKATEARSQRLDLADKAAALYAPVVHLTAAFAAFGWLIVGAGWYQAIVIATTVLIITCPCALALAVPAVQVSAAGALFRKGIFLNAGSAIERLSDVDHVVFDKTGTLTLPELSVADLANVPADILSSASRLALSSRHPLARALANHAGGNAVAFDDAEEVPGEGVRALVDDVETRLGSAAFCGVETDDDRQADNASILAYRSGDTTHIFRLEQAIRPDAADTLRRLRQLGLGITILSGDRETATESVARALGVADWAGGLKPADKIARIEAMAAEGRRVAMVGDGLNDAPALTAAHVSISPATAVDLTQAQADAVFLGASLAPVADGVAISRRARRLMAQNLGFAAAYNLLAIPLAVFGLVTPLIAAIAMSASSLIVTANAMRALPRRQMRNPAQDAAPSPAVGAPA